MSHTPHFAGVRYVVIPTKGLPTFEEPLALPVGDDGVEELLLDARVVQVVVDDLVTERSPCHATLLQRGGRLAQRRREAFRVRLVSVPLDRGRQLEPALDPVEARRDQRGDREVRVDVAAGNPRLDARALAVPDDAEAGGAVVVRPRE